MENLRRGSVPAIWIMIFSLACTGALMVGASDPDPLQDFCVADMTSTAPKVNGFPCKDRAKVTAADFLHTGLRNIGNISISGTGATATLAFVSEFPGLNTQGLSHGRIDFAKGGVFPPHTNPLATETLFILEGTIYTGFVGSDNVLYASTLQKGDLTVFPRATQHFQINVGNGPAATFNTLNSQNPGVFMTANQLFEANIPTAVLQKAMGISATTIKEIQASIPRFFG